MRAKIYGYLLIYLGLLSLNVRGALAGVICRSQCADGEYCTGSDCKDCEKGTYISETLHEYTSCKPWTEKPSGEHWMIKKYGTPHSDHEWTCEPGYHVIKISVGQEECHQQENQTSTMAWDFTPEKPSPKTIGANDEATDSISEGTIAGGVVGVIIILLLVIIIIIIIWKRHEISRSCCLQLNGRRANKSTNGLVKLSENGQHKETEVSVSNSPEKEAINGALNSSEKPHVCKPHNLHIFSKYLFNQLGKRSHLFLKILKNENRDLNIDSSLYFRKTDDVFTGYVTVFSEWVQMNPSINHLQCVTDALTEIQREDVLHNEDFRNLSRTAFSLKYSDSADTNYEGQSTSTLLDQSFYNLAIFVVRELGNCCEAFLLRLKSDNKLFNMKSVLHCQLEEHRDDYFTACADAMVDWRNANPSVPHLQCIKNVLIEMDKNDIVHSNKFRM